MGWMRMLLESRSGNSSFKENPSWETEEMKDLRSHKESRWPDLHMECSTKSLFRPLQDRVCTYCHLYTKRGNRCGRCDGTGINKNFACVYCKGEKTVDAEDCEGCNVTGFDSSPKWLTQGLETINEMLDKESSEECSKELLYEFKQCSKRKSNAGKKCSDVKPTSAAAGSNEKSPKMHAHSGEGRTPTKSVSTDGSVDRKS